MRGRLLGLLALTMIGTSLLAGCGSATGVGHDLTSTAFEKMKTHRLPDGGKVAVGSPDGHRIVVQWQDPASASWTAAKTIYTDPRMWTHDIEIVAAGSTVAVDPDFWTQKKLDDDYDPDHTVGIICRHHDCLPGHRSVSGHLSGTSLDGNGSYADFSLGGDKELLWTPAKGFREASYSGLPKDADVSLLSDGSYLAISGEPSRTLCSYRLWSTKVQSTSFTSQALSAPFASEQPCTTTGLESPTTKSATTYLEDAGVRIRFSHRAGVWRYDAPATPLVNYPNTDGRTSIVNDVRDRKSGGNVALGSPDGNRIMAQFQAGGSGSWTRAVQVATAPAGTRCHFIGGEYQSGPVVAAQVWCNDTSHAFDPSLQQDPEQVIELATANGTHWDVATVAHGSTMGVLDGAANDLVFPGPSYSYVWKAGEGMRRINLPINVNTDAIFASADRRTVVRTVPSLDGSSRCNPGFQVAAFGAKSWPKGGTPFRDIGPDLSKDHHCGAPGYGEKDGFHVTLQDHSGDTFTEVDLRQRNGTWVATTQKPVD